MRRGLLAWSQVEVPRAALEARVARLRAAMQAEGLDALLVYTSFPRPAGVSWLTHFVPYWNQGVLAVPTAGPLALVVALSKRVAGWIGETAHVGEVVSTPRIGAVLAERLGAGGRIGVVELPKMSAALLAPVAATRTLVDATALFAGVRNPADEVEIALSRRAAEIAADSLAAALAARPQTVGALAGTIERTARLAGTEEILIDLAPDLAADAALRRIEGDVALGDRYAVRLSLAYKGFWVRYGRAVEDGRAVDIPPLPDAGLPPGALVEGCVGLSPLVALADPPAGAVVSVGLPGGAIEPIVLATAPGEAARRLI